MNRKFKLKGTQFIQATGKPEQRGTSKKDGFVVVKTDEMFAFYEGLKQHKPRHVMEVGMYEGGSLVWYDKLYNPEVLVGLDIRRDPIKALEEYREDKPHIRTYYGRYQEKEGTRMAARQNFPEGMDLVVDDASHLYEQTKATFNMLFPMVRAGGHYVIEDWAWFCRDAYQGDKGIWKSETAMSTLILELVTMAAKYRVIESIHVQQELVCIKKGKGVFRPEMFEMDGKLRGRDMPKL